MGKGIGASLIALILLSPLFYLWFEVMPLIKEGDEALIGAYEKESLGERYLSLNRAVNLYLRAERKSPLLFRDWMLSERIGDALFSLSDYPEAAYYYWTAFLDHPRKETRARLLVVLSRLNSHEIPQVALKIAPSYAILALIAFCLLCVIFISFSYNKLALLCAFLSLFCFGYLTYARYFTPVEGIVLKETSLRFTSEGHPLFKLSAGDKVELIDLQSGAVKVRTSDGSIGYLDETGVRVLR